MFKRAVDVNYKLKRRTSRQLLSEVNKDHPTLPFTLRSLKDATQAKAGVIECVRNDLLHAYPVLKVQSGESSFVALSIRFLKQCTPSRTSKSYFLQFLCVIRHPCCSPQVCTSTLTVW